MTWVLVFYVMLREPPILGGEYQTKIGCLQAAKMQESYWRERYGRNLVSWKCIGGDEMDAEEAPPS